MLRAGRYSGWGFSTIHPLGGDIGGLATGRIASRNLPRDAARVSAFHAAAAPNPTTTQR